MKKILIASSHVEETARLTRQLEKTFDVYPTTSPDLPREGFRMFDLVLLDAGFVQEGTADLIAEILSTVHIPILVLTPPDDPACAIQAIRAGAFNYVVKFGQFEEVLPVAIDEAISRFGELEQLKSTIETLKAKIAALEEVTGTIRSEPASPDQVASTPAAVPGTNKRADIVKEIVSRFRQGEINLPSIPQITIKFKELVDKGADYRQIAALLKQDLAITSKLIMVSNSVLYKGIETNKTLEQAVSRLGIAVTQQYVNVVGNRALYTISQKKYIPYIEHLWHHSLACAYACQSAAKTVGHTTQFENDPFILGLLHDIGKLILLQVISELEAKGKFGGEVLAEDVLKITEAYHGQFGSALLKRWHFLDTFAATAMYHDNLREADPITKDLLVVHFGNLLVKGLGYAFAESSLPDPKTIESTQLLRITPEDIVAIRQDTTEYMDNVGKAFF